MKFSSRDKGGDFFWAVHDDLFASALGDPSADTEGRFVPKAQSSSRSRRFAAVGRAQDAQGSQRARKVPLYVSGRYGDYVTEMGEVLLSNVDNHDQTPPPGTTFRGTPMPYFMRIFGGIGLHAGPLVGHPDSHGCVRFPQRFAQRLFDAVPLGTKVDVVD